MPDWSYQTIFRPLLFRMPARLARGFTLRSMRSVSLLPGGTAFIRMLGHMEPAPILESTLSNTKLTTPVGLSGAVDPQGNAIRAISQLGFGFVEIGPITRNAITDTTSIQVDQQEEAIIYQTGYENVGAEAALQRIRRPEHKLPQFIRIAPTPHSNPNKVITDLKFLFDLFSREHTISAITIEAISRDRSLEENLHILEQLNTYILNSSVRNLLLYIPLDLQESQLAAIVHATDLYNWRGFVIGGSIQEANETTIGRHGKMLCLAKLHTIRSLVHGQPAVFASAGVHEPADALELIEAGADYLLLHSGFIFAGPGLPKRVNEAIIYSKLKEVEPPNKQSFWKNWGWMCLLGIGMMIGGITAWIIASTIVILPYDAAFLNITKVELHAIDEHLLHFMSHDRVTLAGTMISIGIFYYQLARNGLRFGLHWTKTALFVSCAVGFPSFFLYLGYGFFDPLHAAAAIVLFPMFLLSMRSNPDQLYRSPVNLHNSLVWRRALWGQLCFIVLGIALCIGGIVITIVGITNVFVPEDLSYMGVTRDSLHLANSKLIPLIAHDRAGFGGALLSDAVIILIFSLWGLQQGAKWMWWTLLAGGAPGFAAGLSVHFAIGYTDFVHLLPAYFVFTLYIAGLILLYPYLMRLGKPH